MNRFASGGFAALVFLLAAAATPLHAQDKPVEGSINPFLGEPELEIQRLFTSERFPNVVVSTKGTVLALWGSDGIDVRRSEDGGKTWGEPINIAEKGIHGGGATVDEATGRIFAFVEEKHPPAKIHLHTSDDDGRSWQEQPVEIKANSLGHLPSMHMNESGITLRHGKHAGRLLRATRWYAGGNGKNFWPDHYTNAMYSDDAGRTWQASEPFPEKGTGEAAVAELSDGRIYYNSRVHWDKNEKSKRRRHAYSDDGGRTWKDFAIVDILPDGDQHRSYGCMGGQVRLPVEGQDVLLFSNLDTDQPTRERVTVWASFDGGNTWPVKRLVFDGPSAYSSLTAGRPGTESEGWAYLFFESAPKHGRVARFNLTWLLEGEATGDGQPPAWATGKPAS